MHSFSFSSSLFHHKSEHVYCIFTKTLKRQNLRQWGKMMLLLWRDICFCHSNLYSLWSREVFEDFRLLCPLLLDILMVGVVGVLSPLGLDRAHQHGHNDEGKHADHQCQIPDDVPEVLLSQGIVQGVSCGRYVLPPVVQVLAQSAGQRPLQVQGQVGPIRCTDLVIWKENGKSVCVCVIMQLQ